MVGAHKKRIYQLLRNAIIPILMSMFLDARLELMKVTWQVKFT